MKKKMCKKNKKVAAVLIIGTVIGGVSAYLATMMCKKRKSLANNSYCYDGYCGDNQKKSHNPWKKRNEDVILNDTVFDQTFAEKESESNSEGKCNSSEWERGPENPCET